MPACKSYEGKINLFSDMQSLKKFVFDIPFLRNIFEHGLFQHNGKNKERLVMQEEYSVQEKRVRKATGCWEASFEWHLCSQLEEN
jgi:hypothetical protein